MIAYQNSKAAFLDDVMTNAIEDIVLEAVRSKGVWGGADGEINSWKNSLPVMYRVLVDPAIPDDCGVAIEYNIPQTGKRVDMILTGKGGDGADYAVLIELKQWAKASKTTKDAVVVTFVGGTDREVSHPSYQAWSYAALLEGFNQTVYDEGIRLKPCAYLHNYADDGVITDAFYNDHIEKTPLFLKADAKRLQDFIKQYVRYGDRDQILYRIDNGTIRPSKALADSIASMLRGNEEFVMIDDQKVVYENALALARRASPSRKQVLIVEGGPGTGKSVVAINLLSKLTQERFLAHYVTKNAAPRAVYESKLTGLPRKTILSAMLKGSGSYWKVAPNTFGALIVDEAHRLNAKSGLYGNEGENQIKELIEAAHCTVFFIDEDQRVTLNDIGSKEEIRRWAEAAGAQVIEKELTSQFRCNGSDGYIAWLDNALQIRETANPTLEGLDYDFRIFDSPTELREAIVAKNRINNKARLVAGYCWDWNSKKNAAAYDIELPEYNFRMRWNLTEDGSLWIISPESVNEVGCIHTCQGLEVDYVGVIVGKDLVVRDGQVVTDPSQRSRMDASLKGYKTLLKNEPEKAKGTADLIIKNTYRTLMTRGMKGCYVWFEDEETEAFFRALQG